MSDLTRPASARVPASLLIRPAEARDAEAVAAIYNEGIRGRGATFETTERSGDDVLRWLAPSGRLPRPFLVAERGDQILGWVRASEYRSRECYDGVAEFSVYVASNARGRGVLVVMNDWIHAAHSLTKTSTTAIQTFMSPLRGVVGVATYGKNDFYNNPEWKHTSQSEFDVANVTKLPRVDIVFACADMPADLIDASVTNGAKGIVIAGVGNGNMNKASLDAAVNAAKKGVVVVRSSRVATGNVGRNVEVNDDESGFIASDELNPQKSRILLSLALLKQRSKAEIQNLFTTY